MQQNTEADYQFIPLGNWGSEATQTSISSFRAPSLSESALKTYLFVEKKGGREE